MALSPQQMGKEPTKSCHTDLHAHLSAHLSHVNKVMISPLSEANGY